MFLFIGIYCWVVSYDDIFEDFVFMIFFLLDMGSVFWKLVILECKYQYFVKVEEGEVSLFFFVMILLLVIDSVDKVLVVKVKVIYVIMNFLIIKQIQESIQYFE